MPLLEVEGLTVSFGSVQAVRDVSLGVDEATIVGLIGPNGAGKTTTIDAVTGFVPSTGRVRFGEEDLSELRPHQRARRGMVRTWQSLELFDDLSVRNNLEVAADRIGLKQVLMGLVAP